ncbi:hypothetical protein TNCV_1458781 [Trichonephila clavipes]|nr:hypothetical protein TNCV_1458781 [Trichonephila clavipes]
MIRLQVDPEWKLVDVITRPVRPERQREDTTNKRRKTIRSNQTNTRRPCPYYLRSRIQEKDRIHENLNNIEINGIPGSIFRRRSLSMEALNGDPVHRFNRQNPVLKVRSPETITKRPPVGVVWKLRKGWCQLRFHPRHLTVVQNYEVHHQNTRVTE